ncbi:MAG: lamin tail domain-containing protein, partial [Methanophagales archaeon]|nr:lamin tail domain-containing protein [Methanophagales archaeon]
MIKKVSSCLVMLAILTSVISGVMPAGVATSSTGTGDSVIITEIMYNPEGTDANHEWIELYNNDTKAINITGWKFYESGTNHTLTLAKGNMTIPIGGYAIIANNATMFLIDHPVCNCTVIESSFSLNNTVGEYIALRNATSDVIDDVTYEPIAADDFTLELNASGGWEESKRVGGTPCQPNSVLPPTSFMVYGYVFYENNTACNYPIVNITNVNTGENWSAERNASTNYYQFVLSSTVDVIAGDTLRFDAKSPSGNQTKNIEHVITQDEIDNGGLYNFNITLERAALTVTATPAVVYVGENTSVVFNVTS